MKAIIVEDDFNNCLVLREMVSRHIDHVEIIGEAYSVTEGIELIKRLSPNFLFLDVEFPDGSGFDLLRSLDLPIPTIFTTAYDEYTLDALRARAVDYLLKPLNLGELKAAVERLRSNMPSHDSKTVIIHNDPEGYSVIDYDEISFIESQDNCVVVSLRNKEKKVFFNSLKYFENILPAEKFYRIHKSFIVNLGVITFIENGRTGEISLLSGQKIPVAARRKAAFMRAFKGFMEC